MPNSKAAIFDKVYSEDEMYYGWDVRQELIDFCQKIDMEGMRALDIGSGEGRYSLFLAQQGCEVLAVDYSSVALHKLTFLAQERGLNIATRHFDVEEFDFSSSEYDFIVAATILDHLDDEGILNTAQNIVRALKQGGYLYVNVFTTSDPGYQRRKNISEPTDGVSDTAVCIEHYFDRGELKALFKALHVVYYYEGMEPDHSHGSPHSHGWACLIAQKI